MNRIRQKALGAFYTPEILARYIAGMVMSLYKPDLKSRTNIIDPASGDSILLRTTVHAASERNIPVRVLGIDKDRDAIIRSEKLFSTIDCPSNFVQTDGLYPMECEAPKEGWSKLEHEYFPTGANLIVSNPPWGTDKGIYDTAQKCFDTARGQFDIYDLFIETCINILGGGGCYGIVVPDSIYSQEHTEVRKLLLQKTELKYIIRIGEGFFPNVNMAISLIFGIKGNPTSSKSHIKCAHLSTIERKKVLAGETSFNEAVRGSLINIPAKYMIDMGYSFVTDVKSCDKSLMQQLHECSHISDVTSSQRGVELSKKGVILQCAKCSEWFPLPRTTSTFVICPHCRCKLPIDTLCKKGIITSNPRTNSRQFISGENIARYKCTPISYIELGVKGINYKSETLYKEPKIIVRKTGVGITAGMDYNNCWVNQVVYILRRKQDLPSCITNEVILAILNSRILTYYIIKDKGSNGWKTHAYLSQSDVGSLPFPQIDVSDPKIVETLSRITTLVEQLAKDDEYISPEKDSEIERYVAGLFGLNKQQYQVIFDAIKGVQQMIPFRRLGTISPEHIFENGI